VPTGVTEWTQDDADRLLRDWETLTTGEDES